MRIFWGFYDRLIAKFERKDIIPLMIQKFSDGVNGMMEFPPSEMGKNSNEANLACYFWNTTEPWKWLSRTAIG